MILGAHLEGSSGPARSGSLIFQVCSRGGGHSSQIIPLSSAECAKGGSGAWAQLITMQVNGWEAFVIFGVGSPRTIGFRFNYLSQGSGIANGGSAAEDFKWVVAG